MTQTEGCIISGVPKLRIVPARLPTLSFGGRNGGYTAAPAYSGAYEAVPSSEEQVFGTADRLLSEDFIVKPIPQNYGLISYNGYELTVS